jgi:hypothetical protein
MPMPIANAVHGRLLTAVAKGWGESDWVEGIGRGVSEDAGLYFDIGFQKFDFGFIEW